MEDEIILKARAELAALSDDAKAFVHTIIGDAGIAREHVLGLGSRLAEVFGGTPAVKLDTSDLELRLKTALEDSAALSSKLATMGTDLSVALSKVEALEAANVTLTAQVEEALKKAAETPAPAADPLTPPAPQEEAPAAQPAEANVPQPADPLTPPAA